MKKLLSVILALVMILSLSTVAFANDYTDSLNKQPKITKRYQVNNGTAPAEDFTYGFTYQKYVNGDGEEVTPAKYPIISDVTIAFDATAAGTVDHDGDVAINIENCPIGVYTYEVVEKVPTTKTTGVTYSSEKLYLVLTILRDEQSKTNYVAAMHYQTVDGDKASVVTNQYDSGKLTVSKNITGNMADMSKKFEFTITFTAPAGTQIKSAITSTSEGGHWSEDGLTYTVSLGHGESVTLSNIPAGTTYTVTEDAENYKSDGGNFSDPEKKIAANDEDTVTFTNTLTSEIDTGVALDSLPYVLLLAVACVGMAVVLTKKRRED